MIQVGSAEVLRPLEGAVHLIGRPHPLRSDIAEHHLPAGLSIAEMLAVAIPDAGARRYVNVYIAGAPVPAEWHERVRPKPGSRVEFRAWVQGGDTFRTLLSIAVLVVAAWAGPAAALAFGMTGTAATLAAGLITAGASIVGSLLVNAIAPPPAPGRDALGARGRQELLPGIRGSQNRADPYGPIPLILGRHLVVPLLGAEHYVERSGDEQYLRSLFVVGYGPLTIADIKIGDTPIDEYDDIEIEIREGWDHDDPITLYPGQVFQEDLSIELPKSAGWQSRRTAPDIDEVYVDTVAPNGVGRLTGRYGWVVRKIKFQTMFRRVGTTAWFDGGIIVYEERLPRTRRRSRRIKFPARGQYEVRIRRVSGDAEEDPEHTVQFLDLVVWASLRSIRNDPPVGMRGLAMIAVRIRATDQLSNVIDDLNCVATSLIPDWNGSEWVTRATRNPASIYRHLLRGPHLKRRISLSRLDLPSLQAWHTENRQADRRCDAVIQGQRTLFDALKDVAAAGRAAFLMKDGLYSIKRDIAQDVPVQMLTPRNIISLAGERTFPDPPDAFRVQFVSAAAGYQPDELIVYADGKNKGNAATFDRLDLWGVTEADQAFRDARYHMAVAKLRPERLTVRMDMEHLVAGPGDMVRVAHDVMLVGLVQGRIVSREIDGGQCVSIELDEDCLMETGKEYSVFIRRSAGVSNLEVSRLLVTVPGIRRSLVFRTPIGSGEIPFPDDLVAFGEAGRTVTDWIVNTVDPDEDLHATLILVPHAPAVHSADTGRIPDYQPRTTVPVWMRQPSAPAIADIQAADAALERLPNGDLMPRIIATLRLREGSREPPIARLIAQVRRAAGGAWDDDGVTVEGLRRVVVREVEPGDRYDMRFRVVSEYGRASRWVEASSISVVGATDRPAEMSDLSIEITGGNATLSWLEPPDIDVSYYLVRHSKVESGALWATAQNVRRVPAPATSVEVPLRVGTYLVKSVDHQGRTSEIAAAVTTTIPRVRGLNFIFDLEADPEFAGVRSNTVVDSGLGGLRLRKTDGAEFYVAVQSFAPVHIQAGVPLLIQRTPSTFEATGQWESAAYIDLGGRFTCRVSAEVEINAARIDDDVFAWTDVFAVEDVYGGVEDGVAVRAYLQTTNSNPAGSPTWSAWREFAVGDYTARAFRFRLELVSTIPGATPVVRAARFVVDMPDRVYSKRLTVPAAGRRVDFDPGFYARPDVGLTIQDGAAGDRPIYTADRDGIDIQIRNSAGAGVERVVEILARAYGERE